MVNFVYEGRIYSNQNLQSFRLAYEAKTNSHVLSTLNTILGEPRLYNSAEQGQPV